MRSALPSYSYCVMMTVPAGDMSYCFLLFTHPPPTRLLFLSNEDEIRALAVVLSGDYTGRAALGE